MKYIDADLLRKDIDNWKEAMADAVGEYSDGVRFALEHFTFILDSLQQEQPEEPDKSLEEAAWDCVLDSIDVNNPVLLPKYKELLLFLFIAGAKWQKEQMMKEAVEGKCIDNLNAGVVIDTDYGVLYLNPAKYNFNVGDKVKLIIVRSDETSMGLKEQG